MAQLTKELENLSTIDLYAFLQCIRERITDLDRINAEAAQDSAATVNEARVKRFVYFISFNS